MSGVLLSVYVVCIGLCLIGKGRWEEALRASIPDQRPRRFVKTAYWCLVASLLSCAGSSLAVWHADWTVPLHRRILLLLALGLPLQAAVFAFVLTPVIIQLRGRRERFVKVLLATELALAVPVVVLTALGLWLFTRI